MAGAFVLNPGTLTLKQLRGLIDTPRPIALDPASHRAVDRSAAGGKRSHSTTMSARSASSRGMVIPSALATR